MITSALILVLLLTGPAETVSGKYIRHSDEILRRWRVEHPELTPKMDSVPSICNWIEHGNDEQGYFAALGEALLARGDGELAYRAFHKAQRICLASGDREAAGQLQTRKDACPRVPDRMIEAEEREAMIWVDALQSYERARIARGEDPTDRTAFFERSGRPEEDLNAIVRSHRIAFIGTAVGLLVGLVAVIAARRLRRRAALLPLLVAAALLYGKLTLVRPGPLGWGALFALIGAVAVLTLSGRANR